MSRGPAKAIRITVQSGITAHERALPPPRESQCDPYLNADYGSSYKSVVLGVPSPQRVPHSDPQVCDRESSASSATQASSKAAGLPHNWPATVLPTPGLRQARRKRLESRLGQDGTVYQEGRKQMDEWLPEKPAYLRLYLDIPGQYERIKHNQPLGKCATREEARRKADRWIMRNGINDREKLEFTLLRSE